MDTMMRTLFPLIVLLSACTGEEAFEENSPTDSSPYCEDTATDLTMDEATSLGFTAREVLALAEGTFDDVLIPYQADGGTTPLTITVTSTGTASFVESVAVYPEGGGTAIGVECQDRVVVDVVFDFATDDGAFDESWLVELVSVDGELATVTVAFAEADLDGSYSFDQRDPDEYDDISQSISATFVGAVSWGSIDAQISGQDDCEGDECTAWAELVTVATWGGEGE